MRDLELIQRVTQDYFVKISTLAIKEQTGSHFDIELFATNEIFTLLQNLAELALAPKSQEFIMNQNSGKISKYLDPNMRLDGKKVGINHH